MEYPITPSTERTHLSKDLALNIFLDSFDIYTCHDIGPHLTCTEAEALADLFAAHGRHEKADAVREGHVEEDDEGDLNHNTGEEFTEEERQTLLGLDPSKCRAMIGQGKYQCGAAPSEGGYCLTHQHLREEDN